MGRPRNGGLRVTAALAAVGVVAACGSGQGGAGGSGDSGGTRVAVVIKALDNPFFGSMARGIRDAAKKHGVKVTIQSAQSTTDTTGQADKLNALGLQDYDCYLVNPITGTNLIQPLVRVAENGAPIVNIDRPLSSAAVQKAGLDIATYAGTDNVHAGQIAGEHMVSLLDQGAKVARIGGTQGDVTSQERMDGFARAVRGKLDIVQTAAADWDRGEALTKAQNILRANPDVRGFFVANDDMALGVTRAVRNAGMQDQVEVISVDGIKAALRSIKSGQLSASVSQYPYTIGQMGLEACVAASKGKKLPQQVEAPVELVTPDNADKAIQSFPKPFSDYDDPYRDLLGR